MKLELDFTKSATRASILEQLKAQMDEASWAQLEQDAAQAGVPDAHHHGIVEVRETIAGLAVPEQVKADLGAVYEILAAAEAQVHECEVDHTHFHEVGNGSAIQNSLLICLAFAALAPEKVIASPVQTGCGKIECAHGLMDVPAPATKAIIDSGIPTCEDKIEGELCTPTSAAIIKHFVSEFRA